MSHNIIKGNHLEEANIIVVEDRETCHMPTEAGAQISNKIEVEEIWELYHLGMVNVFTVELTAITNVTAGS